MDEDEQITDADRSSFAAMDQMIAGFFVSRAIYVAVKLKLADLLKDGPRSSEDLAQATGTHAPSLYRLLRVLTSVGVFAEDRQKRFVLTPLGATLRTGVPNSLSGWAMFYLGEEYHQAWGDLLHSVKTGEPSFNHVFGMGVWQYRAQNPESENAKAFNQVMVDFVGSTDATVLGSYPFSRFAKIIDVGGGDGSLLVSLLEANLNIKGVLFEQPHIAEKATSRIAEAGLTSRCEVVAGDALASVPSGGDAYILSRVVQVWNDEKATAILKNCHRAMTPKAKLLLIERVLPSRVKHSVAMQPLVLSDLNMLVITGGQDRTAREYESLLGAAGFKLTEIIPTQSVLSVIEGERG